MSIDDQIRALTEHLAACATATTRDELLDGIRDPLLRLAGATGVRLAENAEPALELDGADPQDPLVQAALEAVTGALARIDGLDRLHDLQARMDNAQQLANMGDYDWHIESDTNMWSDQLYRIYGHEPQSFNASYEEFLKHIHPDDRERIQGIHQEAYATGEPYQMIERVVRPDGTVRYLSSNGQVVRDADDKPVRMRGTCVDITGQVLAKQAEEHSAALFRALVESSPDAIVVFDQAGDLVQANGRASELLGGEPVGRSIREVLPSPAERSGLDLQAYALDGRPLRLDVVTAALHQEDDQQLVAAFLRDANVRISGESVAAQLRESQVRRRQALELNDTVVQGLTAASLALQVDDAEATGRYLGLTLSAARKMMNEWLSPLGGDDLDPGSLLRLLPSRFEEDSLEAPGVIEHQPRILLVDDNDDVRRLLRTKVEALGTYDVVGEAADGLEAIERAKSLKPDVVLLDLAMPRMDGLEALPLILAESPQSKVIVLSGFDQSTMADQAFRVGAHAYVEKGLRMDLAGAIRTVLTGVPVEHPA